ncbi:hypothetical protein SAMN04489726_6942 [Allokutzneria albata]|uniref:Uncharacterized protein n=1 Tax=Allokutzneria albata TaxID=211114 RepID=A0A1H0BZV2_ALLAB|nr:hypothetical protein SAMN04489726_6942 [Allokutzneria albata]
MPPWASLYHRCVRLLLPSRTSTSRGRAESMILNALARHRVRARSGRRCRTGGRGSRVARGRRKSAKLVMVLCRCRSRKSATKRLSAPTVLRLQNGDMYKGRFCRERQRQSSAPSVTSLTCGKALHARRRPGREQTPRTRMPDARGQDLRPGAQELGSSTEPPRPSWAETRTTPVSHQSHGHRNRSRAASLDLVRARHVINCLEHAPRRRRTRQGRRREPVVRRNFSTCGDGQAGRRRPPARHRRRGAVRQRPGQ